MILFCTLQVVLIQWKGFQQMNPSLKGFCLISQLCGLLLFSLRDLKCVSQGISYQPICYNWTCWELELFQTFFGVLLTPWNLRTLSLIRLQHYLLVKWNPTTFPHVLLQHYLMPTSNRFHPRSPLPPKLCIAYFVGKSKRSFPAGTLYSQQEVTAAEALLLSFAGPAYNMKHATNEAVYFSIRRNYSYQCLPSW